LRLFQNRAPASGSTAGAGHWLLARSVPCWSAFLSRLVQTGKQVVIRPRAQVASYI
jgi:hypothetical protein